MSEAKPHRSNYTGRMEGKTLRVRLSGLEWARLETLAGAESLSEYARRRLLEEAPQDASQAAQSSPEDSSPAFILGR